MKGKYTLGFCAILAIAFGSTLVFAQTDRQRQAQSAVSSLYVISAKAGGVNFVSGEVYRVTAEGKKISLKQGDSVETGEKVVTEANGKVEILLNPGSYVRLAENSEFEFVNTALEELSLRVNKGGAMLEVIADKDFKVAVKLPNSNFYLISTGVFRVDVLPDGGGKISVWKGKAQVGDFNATIVKKGKSATQNGTVVAVEKFDSKIKGDLENFSRDRAKEIAKANERLQRKAMTLSLFNSYMNRNWGMSSGFGVWAQDPFSRMFCFVPFSWGWSSPYGFGYDQSIWSYSLPPQITYQVYTNPALNNSNSSSNPVSPPPSFPSSSGNNGNSGNQGGGTVPSRSYEPSPRSTEPPRTISQPSIVERKSDPRID